MCKSIIDQPDQPESPKPEGVTPEEFRDGLQVMRELTIDLKRLHEGFSATIAKWRVLKGNGSLLRLQKVMDAMHKNADQRWTDEGLEPSLEFVTTYLSVCRIFQDHPFDLLN